MSTSTVSIHPGVTYGTINPDIYGHFIEHLGKCVYEGLWVGTDSSIPNTDGVRNDTVEALAKISAPVIRWPGGCFADMYHWEDGIGPRENRPVRPNLWWDGTDCNQYGTAEFLHTCKRIGAEPYICLNVGTGSPQEAAAWMEYCNYPEDTDYTRKRAEDGHAEPWNVKYWAVGNENWGCGGHYTARDYAKEYRRYACFLRRMDGSAHLVACGHTPRDWNTDLLDELKHNLGMVHSISIHRYLHSGAGKGFSNNEYWKLMHDVGIMEEDIVAAAGAIDAFGRDADHRIGVTLDEWGVWHPEAVVANGIQQSNTLRDGIFAASSFNMFHKHAASLIMTNLAQTINVLQCLIMTEGEKMSLTPTYHVYDLYQPHMNAEALATDVTGSTAAVTIFDDEKTVPEVDASASRAADGTITVSVVNRSLTDAVTTDITADGIAFTSASAKTLTGPAADAENLPGEEPTVLIRDMNCDIREGRIICNLPPMSVTVLKCDS